MYLFYLFNFVLWLWAGILLSSGEPILPTPLSQLQYGSSMVLAGLLGATAACGILGIRYNMRWLLLPQQFVAMVVSIGAMLAVWNQQYPDGVLRGWRFILADQALAVLLGVCHTMAIITVPSWWKRKWI